MNWKEYYMSIAETVSQKSKDPSTKVGCVIISEDNKPISFGYNGFVAGCDESFMTFEKPMKYYLTIHAEMNALISAQRSLKGSTVYVTHLSCENCMKHLIQAGVKKIVYKYSNTAGNYFDSEVCDALRRLIKASGIEVEDMNGNKFLDLLIKSK